MNVCRIKYSVVLLALAMLFHTGCQKDSFTDGGNDLLRFRCDSIATRSAGFTQSGQNAILSMGVYAAHTSGSWSVDAQLDFMQNRNVMRADDSSPWEYSPEVYWPGSGMVTFFAYAPHNAAGLTLTGSQGIPKMEFTVDADPAMQADLLVANPLKDYTKTSSQGGYAEFMLRHALTRISFAAKLAGSPSDDVRITGIKVSNLYNTGSCPMDGGGRKWTLPGGAKAEASYSLSNAVDGGLKDAALTNEYETVTTAHGNLFLLPQALTDDAVLDVSYTKNGKVGIPAKIKLSDALAMWQPGEAIRFLINLTATDLDSSFDVELSYTFVNWDNVSTDVEIDNDPFLTVTDVVTSSYDAAVTRVYFYTNQSAASVFIDPVGRVSSLAGATMNVKDEFYGIAPDDPDTTDGFFFDATSSKGYFDLINRNTTTAGNVQNKGKQSLILNLHAGKLHRYITVNPVVTVEAAKQNSERYVGTFHRRNEMGERIVTWHLDKEISWTATIDESVGNHEHLVIDRMASPDYKDNLMYSLTPRAAEGAKVEPETIVSGKGRVYFRVGWKTTSLSANRYARIKVTYSGAGALTEDYIYCRQGEDPDQLNTALNTANFTVYNIASDGVFVEYPSQGGFISQWGRPRMWPLIGAGVPGGYPDALFEEALDPNINICPERHTYPDQDVIDALKNSYTYLQPKWGYYADGYFDRRAVVNNRADNSSVNVASAGILLSLEQNSRSVFLPTAGYRDETGVLKGVGTTSGYWTQVEDVADAGGKKYNAVALWLYDGSTVSDVKGYDKRNSLFMRCVKIENAIVIYFDANGGENAPRSVSASANSNVQIPNKIPGNYWKNGYIFDGWNTKKDGSGTKVNPGDSYAVGSADHTLYAKWIVDPYIKVNFRAYMTAEQQTKYLLAKGQSYELYEIGSNGTKLPDGFYQSADAIYADNEMAFPNLEFHKDINADADWTNAYNYCKSLADGGYKWRLPRAMEFMLVSVNSPVVALKKPEINNGKYLWAGTELNNTKAYSFLNVGVVMLNSYNKTEMRPFRCVREIKE